MKYMAGKKTVLVIDDDLNIRKLLEAFLCNSGYAVATAESLLAAESAFEQNKPDIVLCDLNLGPESGLRLVEKIAEDTPELPVIAISGTDMVEDTVESFRAGAWDFICKPFGKLETITKSIDKAFARAKHLQENLAYKDNLETKLTESYAELKQAYDSMEERVKERTAELAIANDSLIQEVAARHEDELALKDREERFRALFDSMAGGVVVCDYNSDKDKFEVLDINKAGETFLGVTLELVMGQAIENVLPMGEGDDILKVLHQVNEHGGREHSPYIESEETRVICWHENEVYKLPSGQLVVLFDDVTLQKRAENDLMINKANLEELNEKLKSNQNQLVQSEKMASIGQLAAGVAHEINNPVGFITSNLGTLSEYVDIFSKLLDSYNALDQAITNREPDVVNKLRKEINSFKEEEDLGFIRDDVATLLDESKDGAIRVKEIVQNLKSFARLDEDEYKEANINDGIEATLKIVWNELKYKCEVVEELGDIPDIMCNPGQLNQVFMNLLVNASHAIEERGAITITTSLVGTDIVVLIKDTGKGIEPEHINKLFDPFFTTKPAGVGTGLGLSISHGIISDHGGAIEVMSELGQGTEFKVLLPVLRGGE